MCGEDAWQRIKHAENRVHNFRDCYRIETAFVLIFVDFCVCLKDSFQNQFVK